MSQITRPVKISNVGGYPYARCSTDAQDLTAQRDRLRELGVAEDRTYLDHGLTGTTRNRPDLDQALAAVLGRTAASSSVLWTWPSAAHGSQRRAGERAQSAAWCAPVTRTSERRHKDAKGRCPQLVFDRCGTG